MKVVQAEDLKGLCKNYDYSLSDNDSNTDSEDSVSELKVDGNCNENKKTNIIFNFKDEVSDISEDDNNEGSESEDSEDTDTSCDDSSEESDTNCDDNSEEIDISCD